MAWKYVQYENGKYRTGEGGGGGGSSTFADLDDVSFSDLQNGQVPKYNSTTQKWENANESGGIPHNTIGTERICEYIGNVPVYECYWRVDAASANTNLLKNAGATQMIIGYSMQWVGNVYQPVFWRFDTNTKQLSNTGSTWVHWAYAKYTKQNAF